MTSDSHSWFGPRVYFGVSIGKRRQARLEIFSLRATGF